MKKKLFATILLSTVALSQGAIVAGVSADSTDDKIAAKSIVLINNNKVHNLKLIKSKVKYLKLKNNRKTFKLKMIV